MPLLRPIALVTLTISLSGNLLVGALAAQIRYPGQTGPYPGQTGPYPPGQTGPYPGGQGGPYPGGSGGQYPGGRGGPAGRRGSGNDPGRSRKTDVIPVTTTGIFRAASGNQFAMEADDHRIITFRTTGTTKIERDGKAVELRSFSLADHLTVDATADPDGYFTAVAVIFNLAGTAAEVSTANRTWDLPVFDSRAATPPAAASGTRDSRSSDDNDRPVLRRKTPAKTEEQAKAEESAAPASAKAEPQTASTISAPELPERPATQMRPPDAAPDPDDPGKPQLRRGKPAPRATTASTPETAASPKPQTASNTPQPIASNRSSETTPAPDRTRPADDRPADFIPVQEDPIIVKAREATSSYASSLPNYLVRQVTTRYDSENPKQGWQARDTVTADLTYENGVEDYKNVKVGNKSVKSMAESGGTWSTGEFAGILEEVFNPATGTTFRKSGQETIQNRRADIFKFEVKRENARWRINMPGQLYYPAYRGSLWIDRETSRVLRLEMESRGMPALFPLAKVETAIDFEFVRLGSAEQFLLPTVAEVLSCEQGSPRCTRNKIEFRNYKKFGAESDITFESQ
jgi:hypothetical protein